MINLVVWAFDCATFVNIGAAFIANRVSTWKGHWLIFPIIELKVAYIAIENVAWY